MGKSYDTLDPDGLMIGLEGFYLVDEEPGATDVPYDPEAAEASVMRHPTARDGVGYVGAQVARPEEIVLPPHLKAPLDQPARMTALPDHVVIHARHRWPAV